MMQHRDPLEASLAVVRGYHQAFPLSEEEINHLFSCISMRLVTTVTKLAIGKLKEPNNAYLSISEKPAWNLLYKWYKINPDFAYYIFREACGFAVHPKEQAFKNWVKNQHCSIKVLFPTIQKREVQLLDLSVSST